MVSKEDTKTILNISDQMQHSVANQSEEEILDYLMTQNHDASSASNPHNFDTLRNSIKKNHQKLKNKESSIFASHTQRILSFIITAFETVRVELSEQFKPSIAELKAFKKVTENTQLNQHLSIAKEKAEKLNEVTLFTLDLKPEHYNQLNDKLATTKTYLFKAADMMLDACVVTKDFAFETTCNINSNLSQKYPNYKKTVLSSLLLIGCGLMSVFSQISIQKAEQKEDLLKSRKLAAVNWNVNGHITQAERENIKQLLASNNIKVIPAIKPSSNSIKLITNTTSISTKSASPDDAFMLVHSNSLNHKVATGESILSISQKYKVSISDLISSNPDKDLINLAAGESIHVPNTMDIVESKKRPSSFYSKMPRNMIASRSISSRTSRYMDMPVASSGNMLWPVPSSRAISSRYGPRWGGFHPGIDITGPVGTPIIATQDGVVVSSGWEGGYGKCIIIDHGNGTSTRYAHASALLVAVGQPIKAGQTVAKMGSTGWSTGSHLHYEVIINGRHTNPMRFF